MCHCCDWTPRCMAKLVTRVFFGLALILIGIEHYQSFFAPTADGLSFVPVNAFSTLVSENLGVFTPLGTMWAYILPGLFIVGGLLFMVQMFPILASLLIGIAFGSIGAGVLLKSVIGGADLSQTMSAASNAFIWLTVFLIACSGRSCGSIWARCPIKRCSCDTATSKNCSCGSASCSDCAPSIVAVPTLVSTMVMETEEKPSQTSVMEKQKKVSKKAL